MTMSGQYITWPITDFPYEKGYEYIIEGLCINYFWQDDIVVRTFQCCKILSKQKKTIRKFTAIIIADKCRKRKHPARTNSDGVFQITPVVHLILGNGDETSFGEYGPNPHVPRDFYRPGIFR